LIIQGLCITIREAVIPEVAVSDLVRLSFSLEVSLEGKLEELVERRGYGNRSEFIRDMIRNQLVAEEWEGDGETIGTITLVFDHHARGLHERLTDFQHDHHDVILATTHVHLDHHLCAEVILCRGQAATIRAIADELRRQKGVLHGALSMSSTGQALR
jgi:CopG family nickel-responsive transcriptional regulator